MACRTTTGTPESPTSATSARWPSSTSAGRHTESPLIEQLHEAASAVPEGRGLVVVDITDRAAVVSGLDSEQPRYYLQHALGFQVHDVRYPALHAAAWSSRHRMEGRRKMTDWTSLTYVVVDVEGNGQQPPDLVELAVVPIVTASSASREAGWSGRTNPIKHFATRIHGLTNEDVAGRPAVRGRR